MAGTNGQPHTKERIWTTTLYHIQKLTQNELKRPKFKSLNYKTLRRKHIYNLCDLGLGNSFLDITPKAQGTTTTKNDTLDFIKI